MGGTPDTWVTSDSDSSCSESAAADTSAGKGRCMRRWGSFPSGGDVGGGRFAARTVAVRSYPRVRSSPNLPYLQTRECAHTRFHVLIRFFSSENPLLLYYGVENREGYYLSPKNQKIEWVLLIAEQSNKYFIFNYSAISNTPLCFRLFSTPQYSIVPPCLTTSKSKYYIIEFVFI